MTTFTETDIALVTGGGSGIGRETCRLLASQGATVVVTDINKKAADETLASLTGKNHTSLRLDVTSKEEIQNVVTKIKKRYSSPPNIAINCAGVALFQSLLQATEDTYNWHFDVNIKGTIWVTQEVCKELVATKRTGSIVNISSIASYGVVELSLYSATKGAVKSFTFSAGKEFGPHGIRVNCVSPGGVDTPMNDEVTPEEVTKQLLETNPLRRLAKPIEIAEFIAFLASNKASYANADCFKVNGGNN